MLQSLQLDITVVVNRHTISQGTGNKCSYGSQRRISYFFSYVLPLWAQTRSRKRRARVSLSLRPLYSCASVSCGCRSKICTRFSGNSSKEEDGLISFYS